MKGFACAITDAWMEANADNHAWNACAIENNVRFVYFRNYLRIRHALRSVKKEKW